MISALWWIPLVVAGAALLPLWFVGRHLAQEVVALRESVSALHRLRPGLIEVRAETERARRAFGNLGPR